MSCPDTNLCAHPSALLRAGSWKSARSRSVFSKSRDPRLTGGEPDLVGDDGHHEEEVEAERPEDEKFWAFEMAAGVGMFFGFDELVGFEGGEDPGLIGGCGVGFGLLHHLGSISFTALI